MTEILAAQADIIMARARSLMQDEEWSLNPQQATVVIGIFDQATKLQNTLMTMTPALDASLKKALRHHINNVMTPLLGYAQLLRSERFGTLTQQQMADVLVIMEAVRAFDGRAAVLLADDDDTAPSSRYVQAG